MVIFLISASNRGVYSGDSPVARMPLGVAYLASSLEGAGHEVIVLDLEVEPLGVEDIGDRIQSAGADVVGLSSVSSNFYETVELCKHINGHLHIPTIIGGPHVTALPEISLEISGANVAVCGEADRIAPQLFEALATGVKPSDMEGVWVRKADGNIQGRPGRLRADRLDDLPTPARRLFRMDSYKNYLNGKLRKQASIITARGCPGKCGFCLGASSPVKARSPENVMEEMLAVVEEYGIDYFSFYDDTLTFSKRRFMRLAALLQEQLPGIKYECHVQLKPLDEEVVEALLASGCILARPGIESGDNEILDDIGKNITVDEIIDRTDMLHHVGLPFRATYILGWIDETVEQARRTISFARRVNAQISSFSIAAPLPGTRLWDVALDRNLIASDCDFSRLAFYGKIFSNLSAIPDELLLRLQKDANAELG